ncbi:MAG: hypothetical protein KDI90_06695 [Alphaproteobacteria bacterium]|nr:hypothetical protein [Alphaproteobacteria bacterium]MCB9974919.1 hypothetical protein [Rhodospirillales bacterium]
MVAKNLSFRLFFLLAAVFLLCSGGFSPVFADDKGQAEESKPEDFYRSTSLPLPRFVSLGSDEVHVRAGPGWKYPIKWTYKRFGLPVEIILEFDNWRKVKDHDGQEGWVFHTLLSKKRTALIEGENPQPAYDNPFYEDSKKSNINIMLEPFVTVRVEECKARWCRIESSGYHGWIERKALWGIYAEEIFD